MKHSRLSNKYGVNPSLEICFFCGKGKGVILFGALPDDKEAPRKTVVDYDPCNKCLEQMEKGCTLIEVRSYPEPENQLEIQKDIYPTGRWIVVTYEYRDRVFSSEYHNVTKMLIDSEVFRWIMGESHE